MDCRNEMIEERIQKIKNEDDVDSMVYLGKFFQYENQDEEQAIKYYKMAINKDNIEAMKEVAEIYKYKASIYYDMILNRDPSNIVAANFLAQNFNNKFEKTLQKSFIKKIIDTTIKTCVIFGILIQITPSRSSPYVIQNLIKSGFAIFTSFYLPIKLYQIK